MRPVIMAASADLPLGCVEAARAMSCSSWCSARSRSFTQAADRLIVFGEARGPDARLVISHSIMRSALRCAAVGALPSLAQAIPA